MKFLLGNLLFCGLALAAQRPNILFILTDDQDKHMNSLDYMPKLQENVIKKGINYPKHFCSNALCCPSRANIWTGRMPHNTNVTNVEAPFGGYPKVVEAGWNDNYLPIWMQEAGYNTYYVGKLWNAHSIKNYNKPCAKGFTGSEFLLDPHTYRYYDAVMTRNGGEPESYRGQYSTDVISDKASDFLKEAIEDKEKPWMLTVAPTAPHSNGSFDPSTKVHWFGEPMYPERHAGLFEDYKIPRDKSFNAAIEGGVSWVKDLPELDETLIEYNDEFQRRRLRALQSVDEMIERLVNQLDEAGVLDNTFIFFAADNGYHISQHRMKPGKNCGYDTDINVPLAIRGPGVPENKVADAITSHSDLAPTFLSIAGVTKDGLDGKTLPLKLDNDGNGRSEHVAIEYWGQAIPEGKYGNYGGKNAVKRPGQSYRKNTYKGLRLIGEDYSLYYSVWCTNAKEFFDLKADPYQTVNMAHNVKKHENYKIANRGLKRIFHRLDALMMVLKSCKEDSCRDPWHQLHPEGDVNCLKDALNKKFDQFYANQPKVSFSSCSLGYHVSEEGPQKFNQFNGKQAGDTSGATRRIRPPSAKFI